MGVAFQSSFYTPIFRTTFLKGVVMRSFFQNAKEFLKNLFFGIAGVVAVAIVVVPLFMGVNYLDNLYVVSTSTEVKVLVNVGIVGTFFSVLALWSIAALGKNIRDDLAESRVNRQPWVRQ